MALIHTCEHGRFQQLHELVDLDECVHSHLEVRTVTVRSVMAGVVTRHTKPGADGRLARRPEQEGRVRK